MAEPARRRRPASIVISVAIVVVSALVGWAINLVMESPTGLTAWVLLVLTLVLAALSYVVSQTEKSESERERRADELLAPVDDLREKGVLLIAARWNEELVQFQHAAGQMLHERLEQDRQSTWYVISVSPQGLQPWIDIMVGGVRDRDIRIKWALHTGEGVEASPTLRLQHILLGAPPDAIGDHLQTRVNALLDELKQRTSITLRQRWEIFESFAPHPFMSFLSVPGPTQELPGPDRDKPPPSAPKGTFGFVYPYPMYVHTLGAAPAMLLETPKNGSGEICDYYFRSVLWTFSRGSSDGFLTRIWPKAPAKA